MMKQMLTMRMTTESEWVSEQYLERCGPRVRLDSTDAYTMPESSWFCCRGAQNFQTKCRATGIINHRERENCFSLSLFWFFDPFCSFLFVYFAPGTLVGDLVRSVRVSSVGFRLAGSTKNYSTEFETDVATAAGVARSIWQCELYLCRENETISKTVNRLDDFI